MNELFSALDAEIKSALIAALSGIFHELATTVLIVTHNPQELEGLAVRELIIR